MNTVPVLLLFAAPSKSASNPRRPQPICQLNPSWPPPMKTPSLFPSAGPCEQSSQQPREGEKRRFLCVHVELEGCGPADTKRRRLASHKRRLNNFESS